jgi:3-oxoacyl-(acyl-carrier-protein) synthase
MRRVVITVGSAALALQDAGLHYLHDNPQNRAGVSFGTALGGVANAETQHKEFVKGGPKSVHQMLRFRSSGALPIAIRRSNLGCAAWDYQFQQLRQRQRGHR